jgi:hypothetical protein
MDRTHRYRSLTLQVFEERRHLYAIRDEEGRWLSAFLQSVTTIINLCQKPFPRNHIAGNVAKKQVSLRDKLVANKVQFNALRQMPEAERLAWLDKYFEGYTNGFTPDAGAFTQEAVIAHWAKGTRQGTMLHLDIERHLNGLPPLLAPSPEWSQVLSFMTDHAHVSWYRTEWRIFDPDLLITG